MNRNRIPRRVVVILTLIAAFIAFFAISVSINAAASNAKSKPAVCKASADGVCQVGDKASPGCQTKDGKCAGLQCQTEDGKCVCPNCECNKDCKDCKCCESCPKMKGGKPACQGGSCPMTANASSCCDNAKKADCMKDGKSAGPQCEIKDGKCGCSQCEIKDGKCVCENCKDCKDCVCCKSCPKMTGDKSKCPGGVCPVKPQDTPKPAPKAKAAAAKK